MKYVEEADDAANSVQSPLEGDKVRICMRHGMKEIMECLVITRKIVDERNNYDGRQPHGKN